MSDSAWHGDTEPPRDRVAGVASTVVGEWHWLLFGSGAAVLLVYALLNPGLGVSARAVELLLAGVAVTFLGTAASHAAGADGEWTPEPPQGGP